VVKGWWKDTGRLEDMLEANRLVLEDIEPRNDGELVDSNVEGRVVIEEGARLERTTVRGPAVIGAGSKLVDAYIGPYTAIDRNVKVTGSEIEHSIVLAGSQISNLEARMEGSLLGRDVKLSRSSGMPKTLKFLVGDNADISIP
jgi:glucose-1-phosphate thymidylyltransferase